MTNSDQSSFPDEVRRAYDRLGGDIRRTPLEFSDPLSRIFGARVFIKWECDQLTGSFKLRGALNKIRSLSTKAKSRGVVSASTGNHGLAIVHASKLEGVDLKLFLPANASGAKKAKIESLGVVPELYGTSCEKTEAHAREFAGRSGRVFISPYNDRDIVRGAATLGLEIGEDLPDADDILVPVGGGGLIAGTAAFLKSSGRGSSVHGVEPETSAFMAVSVETGRLVEIEERETVADAVAGGIEPGSITFPLCREFVDRFLTVPENLIIRAMVMIHECHGKMVEGAGALPVAALLAFPGDFKGRKVVAVVSGMNISPERFGELTRPA